MVGYDSIIPPGRVGTITPQVNISKMHGGNFSNSVTVVSNAKNKSTIRLTIKGSIKPIVGLNKSYIRLKSGTDETELVQVETKKDDLTIKQVFFEPDQRLKKSLPWLENSSIDIKHQLEKVGDKADAEGYYKYTLKLPAPSTLERSLHGKFVIKTNHSDRKEITVRGMVQSVK